MTNTLSIKLLKFAVVLSVLLSFIPMAFAENNDEDVINWETKAEEKISLVNDKLENLAIRIDEVTEDDADVTDAEEKYDSASAKLTEAEEEFAEESFEDSYNSAAEAYAIIDGAIYDLKVEDKDKGYGNDEYRCDSDNPSDKCKKYDTPKSNAEKKYRKCQSDEIDDNRRQRYFCRDGTWKEKHEARLDDIFNGFVKANEISNEDAEEIRKEIQELVRKLVALLLAKRL